MRESAHDHEGARSARSSGRRSGRRHLRVRRPGRRAGHGVPRHARVRRRVRVGRRTRTRARPAADRARPARRRALEPARRARTVADYPAQLGALADALGIDRFAVWGYSGGGPYAAVCAGAHRRHVTTAAVVGGHGPEWACGRRPTTSRRPIARCSGSRRSIRPSPAPCSASPARLARMSPKSAMKSFEKQMNDSDRELVPTLGTPAEAMALFTRRVPPRRARRGRRLRRARAAMGRRGRAHRDPDRDLPRRCRHDGSAASLRGARGAGAEPRDSPCGRHAGHLGTVAHVGEFSTQCAPEATRRRRYRSDSSSRACRTTLGSDSAREVAQDPHMVSGGPSRSSPRSRSTSASVSNDEPSSTACSAAAREVDATARRLQVGQVKR